MILGEGGSGCALSLSSQIWFSASAESRKSSHKRRSANTEKDSTPAAYLLNWSGSDSVLYVVAAVGVCSKQTGLRLFLPVCRWIYPALTAPRFRPCSRN